jgi:hypothetical protein
MLDSPRGVAHEPYPFSLSSSMTLFMKLIFPVGWLLMTSAAAIVVAATAGLLFALPLVAVIALVLALLVRYAFPLKTVVAHTDHLVIGNFVREERVDYDRIQAIRVVRWVNTKPTILTLRSPCGFGDTIMFIPRADGLFDFSKERTATVFLRERTGL